MKWPEITTELNCFQIAFAFCKIRPQKDDFEIQHSCATISRMLFLSFGSWALQHLKRTVWTSCSELRLVLYFADATTPFGTGSSGTARTCLEYGNRQNLGGYCRCTQLKRLVGIQFQRTSAVHEVDCDMFNLIHRARLIALHYCKPGFVS